MASILRSSKFVRYIVGFARNVVVNGPREFDGNFVNSTQCLCGASPLSFANQAATQHDQNLENSLRRIDQDVRRSGRISRRDIEDVLEEIRSNRTATSSQSLLVIRCCGNLVPEEMPEVRTKLVQEIWNTLNRLNIPMDISHYNALLRVYLENEHPFSPTEFLSELELKGFEPNRVTYQRLIARYCQDGDIEGATKILEFMKEKQLPVNEMVFNALIVGHSEAGDMDSAHGIINVMTQAGLQPSADTYTTLACGYAKNGDIDIVLKIIDESEAKEVYLMDKDLLDIIYSLATNGHNVHVAAVLSKARKAIGYNQDAINTILRLVNKGQEESAFEILKSMPRTTTPENLVLPTGLFFVKQLIKANRPLETIISLCDRLQTEGMYEKSFPLAIETCLQLGNENLAYPLLEEYSKRGNKPRQHYFWPLLVAKSKEPTNEGIINVLKEMKKFGLVPNSDTMRDYLIPNLKGNSREIIEILTNANISIGASACSLVQTLLQKNDIQEAAVIISKVSAYYNPEIIKRPLTLAFNNTEDLDAYITIIREVYENLDRRNSVILSEEGESAKLEIDKPTIIGNFIIDLAFNKKSFAANIENVLTKLVEQGISISTRAAEIVQDKLGDQMTDNIASLLGKLSSGELCLTPSTKKPPSYTPSHQMNIAQLERLIENLASKKQDVRGLQRQLMTLYYRAKDLEKTEELLENLEKQTTFVYNGGIYAQLLDLYAYHENLEKALLYHEKLKESKEDMRLDDTKIIRLAHLLYKNGRFEESIQLLEEVPRPSKQEDKNYNYTSLVWRYMNALAEECRADDLNRLFNTLVSRGYIEVNNVLLGPLVKVHLVNNEVDKALAKLEECVNLYRSTPFKNEIACKLIETEDAENLQKLTDLSTTVHGEINSLYDLVFSFVECGRIRQARKILETPGLQNRPQRINTACERFQQEGKVQPLEGLKTATKDLSHIDRSDIYYQLLISYIKQNETDKAFGLWTQMQEEDVAPTDQFLDTLGNYLIGQGVEVPFVIPQQQVKPQVDVVPIQKTPLQVFRQHVKLNNVDAALKLKKTLVDNLSVLDYSNLLEKLTQGNRLNEATDLVNEMLEKRMMPINRVFKFVLNKLASAGELDTLNAIGSKINLETKKLVSFDNRMCHANLVVGKAGEYLRNLDDEISNATEETLKNVAERFPRGGAFGILEGHPELLDEYEALAIKYNDKGIPAPINVLWSHYFINGNYKKAEQLWNDHLKSTPRIMFQRIVQTARDDKNEDLIKNLIDHLKISNVTEGALGNAYSCLLDVIVSKGNAEHVISTFETVAKEISIDSLNKTAVVRIKETYDRVGKAFNHRIPLKSNKQQSSTSSSSSEAQKPNQ